MCISWLPYTSPSKDSKTLYIWYMHLMIFHLAQPLTSHTNFKATANYMPTTACWWSFFTSSVCGREAAVFNWSEKPTNKSVLQATCQMRHFQTNGKGKGTNQKTCSKLPRQSLKFNVSIFDKAQGQVIRCYTLKTSWKLKANLSHPFLEYTWKHSLKKTCAMRIIVYWLVKTREGNSGNMPNNSAQAQAKKTRAAVTTAGMAQVSALVQLRYLKIACQAQ